MFIKVGSKNDEFEKIANMIVSEKFKMFLNLVSIFLRLELCKSVKLINCDKYVFNFR